MLSKALSANHIEIDIFQLYLQNMISIAHVAKHRVIYAVTINDPTASSKYFCLM